jgi:hypothetical protein
MSDTTAKIRAKGLDATGVTETIASQMYTRKGSHYMAIVEIKVDETPGEHEYEPGPDDSCLCGAAANAEAHWWPVDEPDGAA